MRNLKASGLALAALLVLSGMTASAASAVQHHFTSEAGLGTVYLTGDDDGGEHLFKAGIVQVKCKTTTLKGTQTGSTVESVEVTPSYAECTVGATSVTIDDEGCSVRLNSTTTANPAETTAGESATTELVCSAENKRTTITAPGCRIEITSQGPLHGVKYSNEEAANPTALTTEAHVFGITYTTIDTFMGGCQLATTRKADTYTDGTYLGNATLRGYQDASHTQGTGIKISTT